MTIFEFLKNKMTVEDYARMNIISCVDTDDEIDEDDPPIVFYSRVLERSFETETEAIAKTIEFLNKPLISGK